MDPDQFIPPILLSNGTYLIHDDDDNVHVETGTSLLIQGDTISSIHPDIKPPSHYVSFDCAGKIICPGFIDTHHHVWQTQLKGRHSDDTLLDYHPKGNLQFYNYTPEDVFWGELGGLMEAIDGGTTTIVDHAHMSKTPDHVLAGLSATLTSRIRSTFCYSLVPNIEQWDKNGFRLATPAVPDWFLRQLESISQTQVLSKSERIRLGLGFDSYFLPQAQVSTIFNAARDNGAKVITSHLRRNNLGGMGAAIPTILKSYNLLGPDIILSHGTGSTDDEFKLMKDEGVKISCTPSTESQMAHGDLVGFRSDVLGSLGSDCHSNNPSSILDAMRTGLAVSRALRNRSVLADGHFPRYVEPTTLQAFNLATVGGARAVGLGDQIGRLQAGRKADILVFDTDSPGMTPAAEEDPVAAIVRHACVSDIEMVFVGGDIVKNGSLKGVEVDRELADWDGYENIVSIAEDGKLGWKQVAEQLRRSRREIQGRIDGCNIDAAKEKVIELWGNLGHVLR